MNKYLRIGLALTALACSSSSLGLAASFPVIRESVIVCDPNAPHNCIIPAADGSIAVTGGGGGGGGAATIANGADVNAGSTTDAAATAGSTGTESSKLRLMTTQLNTINTTLGTPIQATGGTVGIVAGSAVIGHVINDASSAVIGHIIADTGSTTAVTALPALPSGSNVIGHIIADTGSTTAVTALPAIPAGSNVIGHIIADTGSTTAVTALPAIPAGSNVIGHIIADTGSTTAVTALPATPAGTNVIGKVSIDQTTPGTTNLVALAANQSTNIAQMNGVTVTMGNGVSGTGVQRVTLASDGTGQVTLATGANTIGALTANQSVNVAQMNGVATTMGNGVAGTGVQRVAIASDNTAIAGVGAGATGSAVPTNAGYLATSQSAVLKGVIGCDTHAFYDASDNGKKTVVAGVASKKIYVCGYVLATGGTATNLSLTSGTGTDCVTTSTAITPAYQLAVNDRTGVNSPFYNGLITLANADNLCVNASAGNAHQVEVWYTIQ